MSMSDWNKGEASFAREYARSLLVNWAKQCLVNENGEFILLHDGDATFVEVARERKWVSKKELKVLGAGFTAAAGFLKR